MYLFMCSFLAVYASRSLVYHSRRVHELELSTQGSEVEIDKPQSVSVAPCSDDWVSVCFLRKTSSANRMLQRPAISILLFASVFHCSCIVFPFLTLCLLYRLHILFVFLSFSSQLLPFYIFP